jgi:protein ImuB
MPLRPLKSLKPGAVPGRARGSLPTPSWQVVSGAGGASVSPELWIGVHLSTELDGERLEELATRSQRFTPRVCLEPPDGLLLEVKGSLHLFGGIEALSRAVLEECARLGEKPTLALAPAPLAALTAARAGKSLAVTSLAQLVGQLAPLPLAHLRWPEETLERLAHMGVRSIGQVLKLPRAGFARRFGSAPLAMLDRLTGRQPDLRQHFKARERFRRRRELLHELEHHEPLLNALAPLLKDLGRFLESRQLGLLELECLLWHRHVSPTSCALKLAAPLADVARLTELLGERLRALQLPEPVRGCELRTRTLVPRAQASASLWQPGEHGGASSAEDVEFIERLKARLGSQAVYGLTILPSHRPETAWSTAAPLAGRESAYGGRTRAGREKLLSPPWPVSRRPVWLLRAPQRLLERAGRPWRQGPLQILSGVERIETGWWDGGEVRRDYYMARDAHGARLWIFREHAAPRGWYLHGVFG